MVPILSIDKMAQEKLVAKKSNERMETYNAVLSEQKSVNIISKEINEVESTYQISTMQLLNPIQVQGQQNDLAKRANTHVVQKTSSCISELMKRNLFEQRFSEGPGNRQESDSDKDSSDDDAVSLKKDYLFPSPEEVENSTEPAVDMTFATVIEALRYLNVHGMLKGYAVRIGSSYKQKKYYLQCNRSGKQKSIDKR
uniref:Uncharacterized protein n=1 Tax=Arundo donax TaxID=35708 RepID=A0A0A8YUL9_ARUDO